MKSLRFFLTCFSILLLHGCKSAEEKRIEKTDEICNRVIFATASQLINFHEGLQFIGFGGGGALGINNLAIMFNYYKNMNVDTSRKLIVDCVERFIKNINEDKELQPNLKVYPFKPVNVEIDIHVLPGEKPLFPNIKTILFWKGKIEYCYFSEKNSENEKCIVESYETALEIVKNQSMQEFKK